MGELRYLTAGESHGQALLALVEGFPAGVRVEVSRIDKDLRRRQAGYGRGARMEIERDRAEIVAGVRGGVSLGSPVAILIRNADWENWRERMAPDTSGFAGGDPVTRPRPGHADLAGALKYGQADIRNVLERASARETAARVAVGGLCRCLIEEFGIRVQSHVVSIGGVRARPIEPGAGALERAERSPVRCADPEAEGSMMAAIDEARRQGDSLGGTFEVVASGVPPGLGSYVSWDRRLDGRIAWAVMSIPAIKGVEIGQGFEAAMLRGSEVHDEILLDEAKGAFRPTNRAGGLEGGVTNGQPVVVRAAMKPIATLMRSLRSIDMTAMEPALAAVERSDACAVPAAAVVAEAAVAFELAWAMVDKFGGDSLEEMRHNFTSYMERVERRLRARG